MTDHQQDSVKASEPRPTAACACGHAKADHDYIIDGEYVYYTECTNIFCDAGCKEYRSASVIAQVAAEVEQRRHTVGEPRGYLLPCPFLECGLPAAREREGRYGFFVECQECYARGPVSNDADEARGAWNRRVPLPNTVTICADPQCDGKCGAVHGERER